VGLKPACAAACLAGALDFGVIENLPANRVQAKLDIPGFPDPAITHPNVRFQQTRELPREMLRTDSMPLVYVKQQDAGQARYRPQAVAKPLERGWNLPKLRSREDPLVIFTLLTQAAVGAFLALFLGPLFGLDELAPQRHPQAHLALLVAFIGAQALALALSTSHLGKPHRFYRGLYNLRHSPLSREAAAIGLFFGAMALHAALHIVPVHELVRTALGWLATAAGLAALYAMVRCYRIKARPFWDHWQVLTSFCGATLALGPLLIALVYGGVLLAQHQSYSGLLAAFAWPIALGLALEGVGLIAHARYLNRRGGEAAASHLEQRTTFGMTYIARNAGLALSVAAIAALGVARLEGHAGFFAWLAAAALIVITALVGRALFYVLVIPTTMPGAFFWRNRAFEEHARKTGLAKMPQVGVLPNAH